MKFKASLYRTTSLLKKSISFMISSRASANFLGSFSMYASCKSLIRSFIGFAIGFAIVALGLFCRTVSNGCFCHCSCVQMVLVG